MSTTYKCNPKLTVIKIGEKLELRFLHLGKDCSWIHGGFICGANCLIKPSCVCLFCICLLCS